MDAFNLELEIGRLNENRQAAESKIRRLEVWIEKVRDEIDVIDDSWMARQAELDVIHGNV